ncbi:hypothetical protein HHK36_007960 [Tetracentron sinense]|uniref:Helitron helicase-like domain-containing protein n=1 Tax=Tetracentron sinense TaxID=13715 RepID=A0A834ZFL9_TETSI|nr:hypothetical protein HHK36_007960 [Tetracentron sinense]
MNFRNEYVPPNIYKSFGQRNSVKDAQKHARFVRRVILQSKRSNITTTTNLRQYNSTENFNFPSSVVNSCSRIEHNMHATPETLENSNATITSDRMNEGACLNDGAQALDNNHTTITLDGMNEAAYSNAETRVIDNLEDAGYTTNVCPNTEQNINTVFQRVIQQHGQKFICRWEFGSRRDECPYCSALIWIEEKCSKSSKREPMFMLCCQSGKVQLPCLPPTLPVLQTLLENKRYKERIRTYNSMLSFTSMGGKIDQSMLDGRGPYAFRISGENYHRIGSLLPALGQKPKFAQLYVYNTEHEIRHQIEAVRDNSTTSESEISIISSLQTMLDDINPYVSVFRTARNVLAKEDSPNLHIRILEKRDGRQYIRPTASEVAVLIIGDGTENVEYRDIIGDQMQLPLFNSKIDKFGNILEEGSVYMIKAVQVTVADKRIRIVPHEYQLSLTDNTIIQMVEDNVDIPLQKFYFKDLSLLEDFVNNEDSIIDVKFLSTTSYTKVLLDPSIPEAMNLIQ